MVEGVCLYFLHLLLELKRFVVLLRFSFYGQPYELKSQSLQKQVYGH